ncbi:hypothetical protein GGI07_003794 [Coemansia sp. Benny D115]|nr:hypothetical protein GGI07_003794 [Coemansia sp. Benny D115]
MGKRVAEKELNQLNQYDEETEDTGSETGSFQKAKQDEIAKRVIKMPKSRLRGAAASAAIASTATSDTASNSSATNSSATPKPTFSGFTAFAPPAAKKPEEKKESEGGSKSLFKGFSFGQPAATAGSQQSTGAFGGSKPFSFGQPAAEKPAAEKPAGGFSMSAFKPPAASGDSTTTAPSSAASSMFASGNVSKPTFSSGFVPPASTTGFKPTAASEPPKPAAPTSTTPASKTTLPGGSSDAKDEEFYRNIRGLNVSLQKKIGDALEANSFVDLTPLLDQYNAHWNKITQKESAKPTDTPKSAEPAKPAEIVKPVEPAAPAKSNMFASLGSPSNSASTTATAAPSKPAPFSFGSSATSSTGTAAFGSTGGSGFSFGFNKPAVSNDAEKKPFSFGFGKPAESAGSDGPKPASPFSFGLNNNSQQTIGTGVTSTKKDGADEEDDAENDQDEAENADDDSPKESTTAGEEGETTVHSTRAKVYLWDSATSKYKDMGVGNFRINTMNTDTGKKRARILCRQEGSDRITLNAAMFKEMVLEHTNGKKEVVVLAICDSKPSRYLVRVKTADMARSLFEALEKARNEL